MYQNSGQKEASRIASAWQSFIQGWEAGESVQVSVINRRLSDDDMAEAHRMNRTGDEVDWVRADYDELLGRRMRSLRNNITTDKYVTVTARATSAEHAETVFTRLGSQVEHDLRKVGGCQAKRLGWAERVRLLASLTRPGEQVVATAPGPSETGVLLESKDLIAPMAVDRKPRRDRFVLYGEKETYGTSLVLRDLAPDLYDDLLQKLAEVNTVMAISVQMSPMARDDSIERIKQARQGLQMQMINEIRKNEKQNLSEKFLPHDLTIQSEETDGLLDKLEGSNESLVPTCMVVTVFADSQAELEENVAQLRAVAKQRSCPLAPLSFMQLEGLNETLPLGGRFTPVSFDLTSDAAAMFIPFTNQDVNVPGGVIYGTNQITKNMISIDRSSGMNGNAFILGTSGGGKGFTVKNEIAQIAANSHDDIIVIDPEREYRAIGEAFGAAFVDVSASSDQCINPMDLEIDSQSGTDPIRQKAVNILGMLDTLIGGPDGLTQHEQSVIDRCVRRCYRPSLRGLVGEVATPTLRTLAEELAREADLDDPVAASVAASVAEKLELYTEGSYSGFSNQTNVDTSNRFLVYDLYKLESGLRTFGLMVILDQIWNRIVANRSRGVKTHLYIDEFHLMFSTPLAAEQLRSFYQRARKYGLLATGVTQNVSQLLDSPEATMMLANSAMVILLPMGDVERDRIAELKRLSEDEAEAIGEQADQGTGLILTGPARIPFDNKIPDDLRIFDLFDTSPEAMA